MATGQGPAADREPRIYGHRGAPVRFPENTLASFRQARAEGADGIEFDVQLTQDGAAVVLHDDTLDRTTSGSGPVRAACLHDVRGLSAGAWLDARFAEERVPTLAEVCALAREIGLALDVELKDTDAPGRLVEALAEALGQTGWLERAGTGPSPLLVTSFDPSLLEGVARRLPAVTLGYLIDLPAVPRQRGAWVRAAVERGFAAGATLILPSLGGLLADPEDWDWSVPTLAWCGPLPTLLPDLLERLGIVGLITDEPARARRILARDPDARLPSPTAS